MRKLSRLLRDSRGVSNIVGALLLITITIVAAAGFAVMLSEIQKAEIERQTQVAAVKGEELRIMSIIPQVNLSDSTNMLTLDFSVLNMDSRDSRVTHVVVNGRPASNFTSVSASGTENHTYYRPLRIMPGRSAMVRVNFSANYQTQHNVSVTEPLELTLITQRANNFKQIFYPPTPLMKVSTESEDLGVAHRDILVLDASESFDDGSILSYIWQVSNGTNSINYSGKIVRIILSQPGPFYVNLTIEDDDGMLGVSKKIKIPQNRNFNPPVRLQADDSTYSVGDTVYVIVTDISGLPVEGVGVSFMTMSGNVTFNPLGGVTNAAGNTSTMITGGKGVLRIVSGEMYPVDVLVT